MVHLTKEFTDSVQVTWYAHNAAQIREQSFTISMSALMPLLRDEAHEMPTIKHVMDKVKERNPSLTLHKPLYLLLTSHYLLRQIRFNGIGQMKMATLLL